MIYLPKQLLPYYTESNFLTGDIESSLDSNNEWVFEIGCICDGITTVFCYNIQDYIEKIKLYNKTIYFHNLDFDGLFFIKFLANEIENMFVVSSGNLMLSFELCTVKFKNSLSLFPMTLKQIVRKFLCIEWNEWESQKSNVLELDKQQLKMYNGRDGCLLYSAILKLQTFFVDNYDIDLTLTLPSMAMKVYLKHFDSTKKTDNQLFVISKTSKFFDTGYYFGGHTEKFVQGEYDFKNVRYYDINSLYPSSMLNLEICNSKLYSAQPTKQSLTFLHNTKQLFFCYLEISIENEYQRGFPVKMNYDGEDKYYYPKGIVRIKMSEVGYNFCVKYKIKVIKVLSIMKYIKQTKIKPFNTYVEHFYDIRKHKDGYNEIGKLFLNALYGKFGEKTLRKVLIFNPTEENDLILFKKGSIVSHGFILQEINKFKRQYQRFDIAGKITETSRLKMQDSINQLNILYKHKSFVLYTDTDSIITRGKIPSEWIDKEKLGFFKDEIGYDDDVILLGQKLYYFMNSGKKASKGIKDLDLKGFIEIRENLVRNKSTKFQLNRFSKKGMLTNKGFFGMLLAPFELSHVLERLDYFEGDIYNN